MKVKNIFSSTTGSGTRLQMAFFNDNTFDFRVLPIQDASLVIRKNKDIEIGWPSFNKLLKDFPGLDNIKPTRLLISNENDIIWDEFKQLDDKEKPEKTGVSLVNNWVKSRAETVRYRHQAKPGKETAMNKVIMYLGIALTIQVLLVAFGAMKAMYQ